MTLDAESIPDDLVAAVARGEFALLVGAGLSKQADPSLPNWSELLERLVDRASSEGSIAGSARSELLDLISKDQHLRVAEELKDELPRDEFIAYLEDEFGGFRQPAEAHRLLWGLRPSLVMTTNYDKLIEDAYASEFSRVPTILDHSAPDKVQRLLQRGALTADEPLVFHLHGAINDPASIILSERDYRGLLYEAPGYQLVLSAVFMTRTVLAVGFSGDDPELRRLLEMMRQALKDGNAPDYALMPEEATSVRSKRMRKDFGLRVIPYSPSDPSHPEVVEFLRALADAVAELKGTEA